MIFDSSIQLIKENPNLYPKLYKNYHRYLLKRFPYALYYIVEEKLIIVMDLFHHARNPQIIKSALEDRTS